MEARSLLSGTPLTTSAGTRPVRDPWTGEQLGVQHLAGPEAVEAALAAAHGARGICAALPAWKRAEILLAMAEGVETRREELVEAIVTEAGKPVRFARGEVDRCVQTLTFAAEAARHPDGEVIDLGAVPAGEGRTGLVKRVPAGVVVGITPFNFPLNLVAHKIAPAIAAGCPFILKPAPATPTAALILGQLAVDAGWPAPAAHVLLTDNEQAATLVADDRPAVLSFTGSDKVGWMLKGKAGRKKVALELGGAAPVLVLPGADLDLAAERIAYGAYAYAGQVCISVQRAIAHRDVADGLRDRLVARLSDGVPFGDPHDPDTISGPMIDEGAADRVDAWLAAARDAGARCIAGGGRPDTRLLAPALYEEVPRDQDLYRRELFGPAMLLEVADDLDHAVALANDTIWGLQAGVFTGDVQALLRCHEALEYGGIIHDDVPTFRVDHMPYGGVKASGLGREGLRYAIEDYTERRMLALRRR